MTDATAVTHGTEKQKSPLRGFVVKPVSKSMVAKDGIEPPTRGFSIPCSTD